MKIEIKTSGQQTVGVTASLLLCVLPYLGTLLPAEFHLTANNPASTVLSSGTGTVSFWNPISKDTERLNTLRQFALILLANTQELDADISVAISSNFWELYGPI